MADPYSFYHNMLLNHPAYFDEANNLWGIYKYDYCKVILNNQQACIPPVSTEGLNEYAIVISGKLSRLSNPPLHAAAREIAAALYRQMKPVSMAGIMSYLLPATIPAIEIDWIEVVCKKLPVMAILRGFEFAEADCSYIAAQTGELIKIMLPQKTPEQVDSINSISKELYYLLEKHIVTMGLLKSAGSSSTPKEELMLLCISNLAGLFIQSYDAGRGILSNSLLHLLLRYKFDTARQMEDLSLRKLIIEILRFDPPVQHTRRIAKEDITLDNYVIKKGQSILLVLAAANRDSSKFIAPGIFTADRHNNDEHLTFGTGAHSCLAKEFTINMTTGALQYLLEKYSSISRIEKDLSYEPLPNVRLMKRFLIELLPGH